MIKFLRKLFLSGKTLKTEKVALDNLDIWLEEKFLHNFLHEEITRFFCSLKEKKEALKEKIVLLEKAEIKKEEEVIEEKIKSVVLGHKINYLKEMKRFVSQWDLPSTIDLSQLKKVLSFLNQQLDELARRTAKSYSFAQHLFFDQVEAVFKVVAEISSLNKNFHQKLEKYGWSTWEELREKIISLQNLQKKKEKLALELKWKRVKLESYQKSRRKQEKEINKLKENPSYQEFLILKKEEEKIKETLNKKKEEICFFFSSLRRVLKKYKKRTLETEIIDSYLTDAGRAFLQDSELKILPLLEKIKKSLEEEEIKLDKKQKEKALQLLKQEKKDHLRNFSREIKNLLIKRTDLEKKLNSFSIEKLLQEAEYKLEHFKKQILLTQQEIEELQIKLDSLAESNLKEQIIEEIKAFLNIKIDLIEKI